MANIKPSLQLAFSATKRLDPRITFTNASANRSYLDASGNLKYAGVNDPIFDHDPSTGESLGLLSEEARTNYLNYSAFESFSVPVTNDVWIDAQTEIDTTVNATTAPDGTTTAALVAVNTTAGSRSIQQRTGETTAGTYTFSLYVKPASTDLAFTVLLATETTATNGGRIEYTLSGVGSAGTPVNIGTGASTSGLIYQLINGWYRIVLTTTLAAPTNISVFLYPGTRTAQTATSQTYLWGAQLEAGAFPSSYIPTTAAAVTRSADTNSQTVTSLINALENTVVTSFISNASGTRTILEIGDGTANERIYLQSIAGALTLKVVDGGVEQCSLSLGSLVTGTRYKVAFAWKANDFTASINGAACVTDTAGTIPSVTTLYEGRDYLVTNHLNSTVARTAMFPRRLANSTLQGLST